MRGELAFAGDGSVFGFAGRAPAAVAAPPSPTLGTPLAFTAGGPNMTVADLGGGRYRLTKTGGTDELRNARGNAGPITGDCLITIHSFGFGNQMGGPEYIETFVGLNNALLATNAGSAIEAALFVQGQDGDGALCTAHAPGFTIVVGDAADFDAPLFIQRVGTAISFRKGAAWASSVEFNSTTIAAFDPIYCSVLAAYLGSYVEVTFQPIEQET